MNNILDLISRYRPRFVRSLLYMLQASEYNIRDYLRWYQRTRNFSQVEKRKRLVWTPKIKILAALSWIVIALLSFGLLAYAMYTESDVVRILCAFPILLLPFYFPYMLAALSYTLSLVQRPVERRIIDVTKRRLGAHRALKIAISGSYGKTTMREILKTVLAAGKKVAAPPGSYNTPLGLAHFVQTLTGDEEVLIFELGEYYPGDISKLCAFVQPDIGIITGINEAHLEKFGSLESTTNTIFELADALHNKADSSSDAEPMRGGALYVNAENETARARAHPEHMLFSREYVASPSGEWRISGSQSDLRGTSFRMVRNAEIIRVQSKLLGLHMVGPLALAAAIARDLGLSIEAIESGMRKTKAFEHRMEMTVDNTGVITIDDSYNGNPDGVAAVIDFLATLQGHRRFYVTPGLVEMGIRAPDVHREIGKRLAEAYIENVVLIQNSVTSWIEAGLRGSSFKGKVSTYPDMLTALAALTHHTAAGDVVLIQNDWPDQYA